MPAKIGEVYHAKLQWNDCTDERYFVIVALLPKGEVTVALISAQFDLFDINRHFKIDSSHPDFSATGLARQSFIGDQFHHLDSQELAAAKRKGAFTAQLLVEFLKWL